MKYNEWKGLNKEATSVLGNAGKYLMAGFGGLSDVGAQSLILLLAAAGSVGGTAGYIGAKLNAKDKQDIDTIQKEYENERLKSDLGYLTAKTNDEYNKLQNQTKPKAARIFA